MKKKILAVLVSAAAFTSTVLAADLSVTQRYQEHDYWCWATSAQMIIHYKTGKLYSQCSLVNESFGIGYACGNTQFDWVSPANEGQYNADVASLMTAHGVSSNVSYNALTEASMRSKIDVKKPLIVMWSYSDGAAHDVVLKGYSGSTVYINDPWPQNGPTVTTYSVALRSTGRKWTETVYLK